MQELPKTERPYRDLSAKMTRVFAKVEVTMSAHIYGTFVNDAAVFLYTGARPKYAMVIPANFFEFSIRLTKHVYACPKYWNMENLYFEFPILSRVKSGY